MEFDYESEEGIEELMDSGVITAEEHGFLSGYLST